MSDLSFSVFNLYVMWSAIYQRLRELKILHARPERPYRSPETASSPGPYIALDDLRFSEYTSPAPTGVAEQIGHQIDRRYFSPVSEVLRLPDCSGRGSRTTRGNQNSGGEQKTRLLKTKGK